MPGDVGPAGGLIFYVNPNYAADGWRYLEAAPFDQSAGAKWGCFRRAIPGARGTGHRNGQAEHRGHHRRLHRAADRRRICARTSSINGVTRLVPAVARRARAHVRQSQGDGRRATSATRGIADNFSYWTSTQQTTDMANHIDFADLGRQHYDDKDFPRRVRAVRAF